MLAKFMDTARVKMLHQERYIELLEVEDKYKMLLAVLKTGDVKINYLLKLLEEPEQEYLVFLKDGEIEIIEEEDIELQTISLDRYDELIRTESRYKMLYRALKMKDVKPKYLLALLGENEKEVKQC